MALPGGGCPRGDPGGMVTGAEDRRARRLGRALGALQVFIGLGAVGGGAALSLDPTGRLLGMPLTVLEGTPFSDYLVPGLVLLAVNGGGSLLGALACFRGRPYAGPLAAGLGAFLALWIVLQVHWIGYGSWVQPFYFLLGLIETGAGVALSMPGGRGR